MTQKFNAPFGSGGKTAMKPMAKAPMQQAPGVEQDGAAIAAEHGPATEVNVSHEHEIGSHHIRSSHPDGHQHESDHGSAKEAHEHGKKLAGIGAMEHSKPDSGEGEEPWDGE